MPGIPSQTVAIRRSWILPTTALIETHDSVWVFDTSAPLRIEGTCPVYKLECLRGPCAGRDLVAKYAATHDTMRDLVHEAGVLAAAAHLDHIVNLAYPCITDGATTALLIQLRPTGGLADLAARFRDLLADSCLSWHHVLDVAGQAFRAVSCVHELDLVHSKLDYDCVLYHASLGDAALMVQVTGLDESTPRGGIALGRDDPAVMVAPEARASVYIAECAMDVYSMAVLLLGFVLQVLGPGADRNRTESATAPQAEQSIDGLPRWLPRQVAEVLSQCTQQQASARCTAADAAAAFETLQESSLADRLCNVREAP